GAAAVSGGRPSIRQSRQIRFAHRPGATLDVRDRRDAETTEALAEGRGLGRARPKARRRDALRGAVERLVDADPDPNADARHRRAQPARSPCAWAGYERARPQR